MKILKKAFPILLALVILLCLSFPILSVFQEIAHTFLFNESLDYFHMHYYTYGYDNWDVAFSSYYSTIRQANANILSTGILPLVSLLPIFSGLLGSLVVIMFDSLVPFAIAIVSALALAFYFILLKSKASFTISGSLAKVLKIATIVLLGGGILASLLVILPSLVLAIYFLASFVIALFDAKSYTYWSSMFSNFFGAIMSVVTVLTFLLIVASLAVLVVLFLKSKAESATVSKKMALVSTIIAGVGTAVSLFFTLHYSYSRLATIILNLIRYSDPYFNVSYITSIFLVLLLVCVFGGFAIYLVKSIFLLKQLKARPQEEQSDEETGEVVEKTTDATVMAEEAV